MCFRYWGKKTKNVFLASTVFWIITSAIQPWKETYAELWAWRNDNAFSLKQQAKTRKHLQFFCWKYGIAVISFYSKQIKSLSRTPRTSSRLALYEWFSTRWCFSEWKGFNALKRNPCRTQPDLSTICRFLCLTLLASLIASHFFQSSSLHGPGMKFTGWMLLPTFQDSILRVSISSFLWWEDGDSTLPLLFLSSGAVSFSSKHRNLDRISSGRLHGSGKSAGWYLSGAPDKGTSFFWERILRKIMSSFSKSGITGWPSLGCRIISPSRRGSCSENFFKYLGSWRTTWFTWKAPVFRTNKSSFSKSGYRYPFSASPCLHPGTKEIFFLHFMSLGPEVGSILVFASEDK